MSDFIEVTVRLHKDEVKILPACLWDSDSTVESALVNGILAQIIRASKKVNPEGELVYSYIYDRTYARLEDDECTDVGQAHVRHTRTTNYRSPARRENPSSIGTRS